MVWHGRAVGRSHSFVGSSPCRAVACIWPGPLTHNLIFLLDCLDSAAAQSVVPARHYFLYAEVARAKHPKVNKAFPAFRCCLLCLRITCWTLLPSLHPNTALCHPGNPHGMPETFPSNGQHHTTLTFQRAKTTRDYKQALSAFVERRVPRWKN